MKNNEFNQVKINNQGPNNLSEFTIAQTHEATSLKENSPHKDELNAKKTTNDSIELNGVIKHKKVGNFDYKKMKDGTTHLASSAGHAVVAATTVSVAVVAVVVGVSVVPIDAEEENITFTYSEIGTDMINFSFVISSKLLGYYREDEPMDQHREECSIELYATLYNDTYSEEQLIVEMSEYEPDPSFMEAYGYFGDLAPNTDYALDIYLMITTWGQQQESSVVRKDLAFRNFTTLAISPDVTYYHVSYTETEDYHIEGLLDQYQANDEVYFWINVLNEHKEIERVMVNRDVITPYNDMYSFTMPESDVTISVVLKDIDLIQFTDIEAFYDRVSIQYTVNPYDIGFDPQSGEENLLMSADLLLNDEFIDKTSVGYEPEDENLYICYIDFYGLEDSTTYKVNVYLGEEEDENRTLIGSTSFMSKTPDPIEFEIVQSFNYVSYNFVVTNQTIEFDPEYPSQSLSLEATISDGNDYYQEEFINDYEQNDENSIKVFGSFDDLQAETEYTLTILYLTQSLVVELGSASFTTSEIPFGFSDIVFSDTASYYNHTFTVTLDYYDDIDNPNFSNFELHIKDQSDQDLEVFLLDATSSEQTLKVSNTETGDGVQYEYDIDAIASYQLDVYSNYDSDTVTLATGELSFLNSDITSFNGFDNEDFVVCTQEGSALMPIKLDYVDEGHQWHDMVLNLAFDDVSGTSGDSKVNFYGYLNPTTEWQYIYLDPVNEGNTMDMFLNQTATLSVTVNEENIVYEVEATISSSTDWEFFDMGLDSLTLEPDYTDLTAYFVYTTYYEFDSCEVRIRFQDTNSPEEEFVYRFNLMQFPSKEYSFSMYAIYEAPTGYSFATYQNLQETFANKTFNIYFEYQLSNTESGETGTHETRLIQEGVSFTFN